MDIISVFVSGYQKTGIQWVAVSGRCTSAGNLDNIQSTLLKCGILKGSEVYDTQYISNKTKKENWLTYDKIEMHAFGIW